MRFPRDANTQLKKDVVYFIVWIVNLKQWNIYIYIYSGLYTFSKTTVFPISEGGLGEMYIKYYLQICREVDCFGNLSVQGRIILKCVMKKQDSRMLTGFNNLE